MFFQEGAHLLLCDLPGVPEEPDGDIFQNVTLMLPKYKSKKFKYIFPFPRLPFYPEEKPILFYLIFPFGKRLFFPVFQFSFYVVSIVRNKKGHSIFGGIDFPHLPPGMGKEVASIKILAGNAGSKNSPQGKEGKQGKKTGKTFHLNPDQIEVVLWLFYTLPQAGRKEGPPPPYTPLGYANASGVSY